MDRFDDDALAAELRAIRPEPRPEFTAELDERAAAGFPRRESPSAAAMPFALLADRWRALSPRRRLIPALGVAFAVLAVATVVVAVAGSGSGSGDSDVMTSAMSMESAESSSGSEAAEEAIHTDGRVKMAEPKAKVGGRGEFEGNFFGESSSANGTKGAKEAEKAGAEVEAAPTEEEPVEEEGTEHAGEEAIEETESGTAELAVPLAAPPLAPTENAPSFAGHRDIERSASIVLGTKPGGVTEAASKVYEAVHAANGIVLNSSVQSGSKGATGASFELLIPSRKLDDTLATFSRIAEVRERHDATSDITKPTVGATEELADSNATVESLLKELGDAETETEREAVEARLREERRRHAAIKGSLERLHKRASMSEVSVRIVTDHGAGVVPPGAKSGSGDWSVGDALHDAGHILQIAAGVLLIALAVLAPIALIALLIWIANRFRVRRLRERTLG
jgi:Domain of unknown function (DUF4349)